MSRNINEDEAEALALDDLDEWFEVVEMLIRDADDTDPDVQGH